MKRGLLTAIAIAAISAGCANTPMLERPYVVVLENRMATKIATSMIRYSGKSIAFANIGTGKRKIHRDPTLALPDRAVVQWIGADGSHFIETIPVRAKLPRKYRGGVRFVIHEEYVEVLPPREH